VATDKADRHVDTTLTCIVCPRGCTISVKGEIGNLALTGHGCPRGLKYAEQEVTCPRRFVTSTVRLVGSDEAKLLPVRSAVEVPKASIPECLDAIRKAEVRVPVKIGDVIIDDLAGTGIALVAAADAPAPLEGQRLRTAVLLGKGEFLVTSPYGERIHPLDGTRKFHAGVDGVLYAGGQMLETGICACADGTIVEAVADDTGPAGVHVAIDHGDGLVTKYFHLEPGTLRVCVGDKVAKGQLLGWMGTSGRSTGEHLHFQVEVSGHPVDPLPYLVDG
jgi:murein DD-endopeptidase MepM/ murein hydrolase activator NlpD